LNAPGLVKGRDYLSQSAWLPWSRICPEI